MSLRTRISLRAAELYRTETVCLETREIFQSVILGIVISFMVSWIFYRSFWGMITSVILIPVSMKLVLANKDKKVEQEISIQFRAAMEVVSQGLKAGYSMENAWKSARKDMVLLYGEDSAFSPEMDSMIRRIHINEPIEDIIMDFAMKYGIEDICSFAEIFKYAKRSGGNMSDIIRFTVERMQEKEEIIAEITNAIAAKKAEQKVMVVMLPAILVFVTVSSPEYVDILYHNALGIAVMSACLAGYIFVIWWSEKIMNISV